VLANSLAHRYNYGMTKNREAEMTSQERERALEVALVLTMKELVSQGHDLYDLLEELPFTADLELIKEIDRQGLSWE
jgi:hypothetical protein